MGYHSRQRGRLRPPRFFCASGRSPGRLPTIQHTPIRTGVCARARQATKAHPPAARAGPGSATTEHTPDGPGGPDHAHVVPGALPSVRPGGPDQSAHPALDRAAAARGSCSACGGWPGRARPLVTVCRCRSPTPPSGPNSPRGPEPTHTPLECALILENCGWARL